MPKFKLDDDSRCWPAPVEMMGVDVESSCGLLAESWSVIVRSLTAFPLLAHLSQHANRVVGNVSQ